MTNAARWNDQSNLGRTLSIESITDISFLGDVDGNILVELDDGRPAFLMTNDEYNDFVNAGIIEL